MLTELIQNKVYYKIFDKINKNVNYIYGKYKANDVITIDAIESNIKSVISELKADNILILNQVHGDNIIDADEITDFSIEPKADGAITSKKNIILSVQSADCVPVLIASIDGKLIGAAHSGWKSSKLGIVEKLIKKMKAKGAKDMVAIIGPAIQQSSYEVDEIFYNDFIKLDKKNNIFFIHSKNFGYYMFDLPGFVADQLKQLGVMVRLTMEDTYTNPDKYPSYRRSCHAGKPNKNENILSTIMIK